MIRLFTVGFIIDVAVSDGSVSYFSQSSDWTSSTLILSVRGLWYSTHESGSLVDEQRIRFHQQKCEKMENMLHPYSSFCYAWDEPCDPHRLVLEVLQRAQFYPGFQ